MSNLSWLSQAQMERLKPSPQNHGKPWGDDLRVLISIIFINRNGLCWRDASRGYSPPITAGSAGATTGPSPGS